ncbi:MAG: universal stress protein [Bryobacterales bacterium]|nr:universal stress protein [Bryobacterales bacterium]
MPPFQQILFPVDFSNRCERIAPRVASFAHHFQARLTLMHAYEVAPQAYPDGHSFLPVIDTQSLGEYSRNQLAQFAQTHFAGIDTNQVIVRGEPAHAILDQAVTSKADLIMLPTRGFGRFRRLLLGSVSAKVLHDAACPVWTDSHAEEVDHNIGFPYRNILCAVNNDEHGEAVLRYGVEFAKHLEAELTLVHAVQAPEVAGPGFDDAAFRHFLMEQAKGDMARLQARAGTSLHVCVEGGGPEEVVSRIARRLNADLVLIHRSGPSLMGRLRSHDYAIIRESPCPVLSV